MESVDINYPNRRKTLTVINETPFDGGGHEPKWKVNGLVDGKEINLVKKEPLPLDLPEKWKKDPVGYIIHMNEVMTKAGLPVIEMGFSNEGNGKNKTVWQENLTIDGSRLYGPSLLISGDYNQPLNELDKKFLEIWNNPTLSSDLKTMEKLIVDKANSANIQLPLDDEACLLHIRPNGQWGVLIIDTIAARENISMDDKTLYSMNWSSMDGFNVSLHELDKLMREAILR